MKGFSKCQCGSPMAYRTPWCEMLGGCEQGEEVLHLYYKLDWLKKEVEKRSSYLGKYRRTEEAQHLLDLISMTADEEDMFYPFAKAAMADVWDALETYASKTRKAYLWREGLTTVVIPPLPNPDNVEMFEASGVDVSQNEKGIVGNATFDWTDDILDSTLHGALARLRFEYTVKYTILDTEIEVTRKDSLERTLEVTIGNETGTVPVSIYPELAPASETTSAETIKSVDKVELELVTPYFLDPVTFEAGDWVQWNDVLYEALEDGDANNMANKLERQGEDYRDSIHYLIICKESSDLNNASPLDTDIFEALTARIIYKWLLYPYPDEAPRYLAEWEECLTQIRKRCYSLWGDKVLRRIPRYL